MASTTNTIRAAQQAHRAQPPAIGPMKIHWRLPQGGSDANRSRARMDDGLAGALPDLERQVEFARAAEDLGIDSLLVDYGYNKPDSIILSTAIGLQTKRIKLIIASRSGLMSPTTFVQQLNTLSALINGRFSLNIVAGHSPAEQRYYGDFLPHDERYERTEEYLDVCRQFWNRSEPDSLVNFHGKYYNIRNGEIKTPFISPQRSSPEIFVAGSSAPALALATNFGDIWISLAQPPDQLKQNALEMVATGIEVGLRLSVICRSTREEAVAAAERMQDSGDGNKAERSFVQASDSVGITRALVEASGTDSHWLTPCLWNGAVRSMGAPAIALVGSPEDIANAIMEYSEIGVSQLILSGWPQYEAMRCFGQKVLPLLRGRERAMSCRPTNP